MNYPEAAGSVFAMIDMQGKLLAAIPAAETILPRVKVMLEGAKALGIPVIITEQYPKGLGPTLPELMELLPEDSRIPAVEKTSFSCWAEEGFRNAAAGKKTLVLFGVETHVCVLQTALDVMAAGYEVYVVCDAAASRKDSDKAAGLEFMRHAGVQVVTSEMLLFMYLRNSRHPSFKEVSKIIK